MTKAGGLSDTGADSGGGDKADELKSDTEEGLAGLTGLRPGLPGALVSPEGTPGLGPVTPAPGLSCRKLFRARPLPIDTLLKSFR